MLSRPGALPDFNCLMAASSSSTVKSDDRLAPAVAALESEVTSRDVQHAKSVSASGKQLHLQLLDTQIASCFCLSACL